MNAEELAQQLKISRITAELLIGRGIDSAESARDFFYAGLDSLCDPFGITGMTEAVARIRSAIAGGESIVIFGDYDADGISSVSIFYQYFSDRGANVHWYIPEREEGYGVNNEAVEFIADAYTPDLIITCDCGISSAAEVEYIKDLGIDVIVTDHHELPEVLPDCVTVNPKRDQNERLAMLCGAGVVFKVVEALEGREYVRRFLDIAAIATVADSVPLFGENRILVREGLKRLNSDLRPGLACLKEVAGVKEFNSKSLAFSIVPRINAAGRLGEAKRAIALFCGEDAEEIQATAVELDRANSERQTVCDGILREIYASEEFRRQAGTRALIVEGDGWQSGMIGIVASKLADRFTRPVFVFTRSDGCYKGSGRSVEGVNLFQMLSSMPELFVRFGGHSQAAGLTLEIKHYETFKQRVAEFLEHFPHSLFVKSSRGDCEVRTPEITLALCRELAMLEPCGVGNKQPVFLLSDNLPLKPMKKYKMHFSGTLGQTGFTAFNMAKHRRILACECEKNYFVDLSVNEYNKKFSPRGNIRSLNVPFSGVKSSAGDVVSWLLECTKGDCLCGKISKDEAVKRLSAEYGVLAISFDREHVKRFLEETGLGTQVWCYTDNRNNDSKILFAPDWNFDPEGYTEIIYLEAPLRGRSGGLVLDDPEGGTVRLDVSLDRSVFVDVYRKLSRQLEHPVSFEDFRDLYEMLGEREELEQVQFYVCLLTFLELGILSAEESLLALHRGIKVDLEQSDLYRRMRDHLKS